MEGVLEQILRDATTFAVLSSKKEKHQPLNKS